MTRPLVRRWPGWLAVALSACGGAAPAARSPSPAVAAAPAPSAEAPATSEETPPWEPVLDEDGVVVQRREVPGSSLIAFRGEGMVEQPLLRVAMVVLDATRSREWAARVVEARELGARSPLEIVHYSRLAGSLVTSDREFVSAVTLDVVPGRQIRLRLRATDDPRAPKGDAVRGEVHFGAFTLTADGDARTRVEVELHADPKGSLPRWIVNLVQRRWAYKTIIALRKQAARADLVDVPRVRERLTAAGFFGDAPR
ncbi:MAG: hypothetical protein IT374_06225 [Polyangiaceae bacterium]|nr:hypothetical protein [Polyangiaceae bacterium]